MSRNARILDRIGSIAILVLAFFLFRAVLGIRAAAAWTAFIAAASWLSYQFDKLTQRPRNNP